MTYKLAMTKARLKYRWRSDGLTTDGLGKAWNNDRLMMTDWQAGHWQMMNDGPAKFTDVATADTVLYFVNIL